MMLKEVTWGCVVVDCCECQYSFLPAVAFRRGTYCNSTDYDSRHRKDDGVEDKDVLDRLERPRRIHKQIQPRVQHPALRNHHDQPCQVDHNDGANGVFPHAKVAEDDEQGLQHHAPRRECACPEVQAAAALEQDEERYVDFNADVP